MNCPACGGDNRPGARFCHHCGAAMGEALPVVETVEAVPEKPTAAAAEAETGPDGEAPSTADAAAEAAAAGPTGEPGSAPAEVPTGEEEPGHPAEGGPEPEEPPAPEEELAPAPLIPLPAGAVVAGRYALAQVLKAEAGEILYLAHDLQRCWQCGFEHNGVADSFCAQCGAALNKRLDLRLLQVRKVDAAPTSGEAVVDQLTHEGQVFLLLAAPKGEPVPEATPPSVRLAVGYRTDAGRMRELNEDSLLVITLLPVFQTKASPLLGLYAVADGMGGHEGGEVASKLTLQTLGDEILALVSQELNGPSVAEEVVVDRLRRATTRANDAVYLARQKSGNDMGSTLTVALIRDARLFLTHVGDCRAFRWSADGLEQLTTDHSLVAGLIAGGRAEPDEIYTHPHRSVITRNIGDQPVVEVDTSVLDLAAGNRVLLCSDGLWEMLRNTGIEEALMQEADPQAACELLVNRANVAGGEDNISVVMIQVEPA